MRKFFWDACEGFSIAFPLLMGSEGQAFLEECRAAGKEVCVWTVNDPNEMRIAISWGVKAVLTDKVGAFASIKKEVSPSYLSLILQLTLDRPGSSKDGYRGSQSQALPMVVLAVLLFRPRDYILSRLCLFARSRSALPCHDRQSAMNVSTASPLSP
jgi:hypothetical protein